MYNVLRTEEGINRDGNLKTESDASKVHWYHRVCIISCFESFFNFFLLFSYLSNIFFLCKGKNNLADGLARFVNARATLGFFWTWMWMRMWIWMWMWDAVQPVFVLLHLRFPFVCQLCFKWKLKLSSATVRWLFIWWLLSCCSSSSSLPKTV